MIIRKEAYPRVGLIGNPSDGYFGKTIALCFTNFRTDITLYETPELEIVPSSRDHSVFTSIRDLHRDVQLFGYYGGIRLLKAAIKRFQDYCRIHGYPLHDRNFTVRYRSSIPHLVGLAGSSAIITACMRCLMAYYDIRIPRPQLANLILSVETEELGITAGLQDRVAQVYQSATYMDFDADLMDGRGYGDYEAMDVGQLPPLYVAYRSDLSASSEIVHNDFRARYQSGDEEALRAVARWRELTDEVRLMLGAGRGTEIGPLLDENYNLRAGVMPISEGNLRMVEAARAVGASAKFTGSGGAIIGTYANERMYAALRSALMPLQIMLFKPQPAAPIEEICDDS